MSGIRKLRCPRPLTRYTGKVNWILCLGFVYIKASISQVSMCFVYQDVFQVDETEIVHLGIIVTPADV